MLPITRKISAYNHYTGNQPKYILIHTTGTPKGTDTASANASYFCSGDRGASAHYFVDDNSIYQVVEDYNGAWHCGDGRGQYGITNLNSIGIEMCETDFDVTEKTIQNTIELVKHLQAKHGIPDANVQRHYDASRKTCPRPFSPDNWKRWYEFKARLTGTTVTPPASTPSTPNSFSVGNYQKDVVVTADVLNVRNGRGTNYTVIGSFSRGTKVNVWYIDRAGDGSLWGSCSCNGQTGYIHMGYVNPVGGSTPAPSPTPAPSTSNGGEVLQTSYPETGIARVIVSSLNVRNVHYATGNEPVATYSRGEEFNYDSVYITNKYVYCSYVSRSGVRRFVAVKDKSTGERFAECR